jgi:hypothetical protein
MGYLRPSFTIEPRAIHHQRDSVFLCQHPPQRILEQIVAETAKHDDADHLLILDF